jgi:hypothetical protein
MMAAEYQKDPLKASPLSFNSLDKQEVSQLS